MTFEPLMYFKTKKTFWKLEILQKLLLLKVFFTQVIKTNNYFFVTVIFNIFMRQTASDFLGLHKNLNHKFPLITSSLSSL